MWAFGGSEHCPRVPRQSSEGDTVTGVKRCVMTRVGGRTCVVASCCPSNQCLQWRLNFKPSLWNFQYQSIKGLLCFLWDCKMDFMILLTHSCHICVWSFDNFRFHIVDVSQATLLRGLRKRSPGFPRATRCFSREHVFWSQLYSPDRK